MHCASPSDPKKQSENLAIVSAVSKKKKNHLAKKPLGEEKIRTTHLITNF